LIDQATQRERLAKIEIAIDAIREMLLLDDAEWLAGFDAHRDDPVNALTADRLQAMIDRIPKVAS
jgi:hypothetical protein